MHRRVSASLASLIVTSLLAAAPPVSACPPTSSSLHPLASTSTTMAPGGGVLFVRTRDHGSQKPVAYTLVDGTGATVDATQEYLAPGLVRMTPVQHADRELSLMQSGTPLLVVRDTATASKCRVAPRIAKITSTRTRSTPRPRGPYPTPETTTITLATDAPTDVAGIVLYGSDGSPRAWFARTDSREYTLSIAGKGCGSVGGRGAMVGEKVAFTYVDDAGRESAKSAWIVVRSAPRR